MPQYFSFYDKEDLDQFMIEVGRLGDMKNGVDNPRINIRSESRSLFRWCMLLASSISATLAVLIL